MDVDSNEVLKPKPMKHPTADLLDQCMNLIFHFIKSVCFDEEELKWDKTKLLYTDMTQIFEEIILPTHASHHVQFLMFYLISFKNSLAYSFLQLLWRKVSNPNVPNILRQASVLFMASLLARAKFIPIIILKENLTDMTQWIHGYISNQDGATVNYDSRVHVVFYSVCQALFYLIAFRHKDLVNHNKGLIFLQGLNLAKIVTCHLNPLKVCLPAVTSNFASVTRHYQLAYCYSVIEHNARNTIPLVYRNSSGAAVMSMPVQLETYFPFDPYLLQRSNHFINSLYREYDGSIPESNGEDKKDEAEQQDTVKEDEDDFLMDQSNNSLSSFSYGVSPGFLQM
uniref:RNA polymerase I-specific transcription initiation factor RRN3 n=1 Tax=Clastoptera arizonana TaxID=38151 RepID=A0A1B6CIL8_9HEMI